MSQQSASAGSSSAVSTSAGSDALVFPSTPNFQQANGCAFCKCFPCDKCGQLNFMNAGNPLKVEKKSPRSIDTTILQLFNTGWFCCGCETCKEQLIRSSEHFTIQPSKLNALLGDNFKFKWGYDTIRGGYKVVECVRTFQVVLQSIPESEYQMKIIGSDDKWETMKTMEMDRNRQYSVSLIDLLEMNGFFQQQGSFPIEMCC